MTKLYIFSGLSASGKSTLAQLLSTHLCAAYIRIDSIEQGLKDICLLEKVEGQGYELGHILAIDNLRQGVQTIVDSVNPWKITRENWNKVASELGCKYINIEVICSDQKEHRERVNSRISQIKNLKLPTWEQVQGRDFHEWTMLRIVIDTAGKSIQESTNELFEKLFD